MNTAVRSLSLAGFVSALAMASGCATIIKGSSQDVAISTDPTGASCDLRKAGNVIGNVNPTPGTIQVKKGDGDIEVSCKKKGYTDTVGTIFSSLEGWTFGNILFGGVIGVVVDASSGALHNYQPEIFVKLLPEKFASEDERLDFYDNWRNQIMQNSTRAKIAAAKTCSKEQCDEIVKRIDRETEQALAGVDANRNLRNNSAASAPGPAPRAVQTAQAAPVLTAVAVNSANGSRWHPGKGDRWHYRLMDGKRAMGTVNVEVLESEGGMIRERITKEGSAGFSVEREVRPDFSTTAFQPSLQLPGGYTFLELSSYFPPGSSLEPGKSLGEIGGEMYLLVLGKRNLIWTTKVAGQEHVKVPAGEFQAWRIDAVANEVGPHGPLRINYRVWYSEAMQRAVKMSLHFDTRIDIANSLETLELAGFDKAQ